MLHCRIRAQSMITSMRKGQPTNRSYQFSQQQSPKLSLPPSAYQSYQSFAGLGHDASSALTPTFDSSNTAQGYLSPTHQQQFARQPDISNSAFLHGQGLPSNHPSPQFGAQGSNIYSQDLFAQNITAPDSQAFNSPFLASGADNQGSSMYLPNFDYDQPTPNFDNRQVEGSADRNKLMNAASAPTNMPTPVNPGAYLSRSSPKPSGALNWRSFLDDDGLATPDGRWYEPPKHPHLTSRQH
ncbi:hypothetical protein DIS24_g10853 [Lasiodiplodia hormozganensis]|uniref:Uncharacterized protein n=1 Tax=Lasiodiplodia hormozganensis TaxID=869390 RepID=A0AA40C7H9_9PEZI|nr:hypothetical protein DIS24_g10853 [Lasiodiplodia hormozganensis]